MPRPLVALSLALALVAVPALSAAAPAPPTAQDEAPSWPQADPKDVATIDALMIALYDVISGPAGAERDWDRLRSLFRPEGRMSAFAYTPAGEPRLRLMTPAEYVANAGPYFADNPFFEREVARRVERFGHIAHVFSTYESVAAPEETEPFQRGINSLQLVWDGERWAVLSILWDSEREGQEIPSTYLETPAGAGE